MNSCVRSRIEGARGDGMIEMRRAQLSFGDGLITEDVSDLREDWMAYADRVLADDDIVTTVYDALASGIPRAAAAAGSARRPRWCYVCWSSSTSGT